MLDYQLRHDFQMLISSIAAHGCGQQPVNLNYFCITYSAATKMQTFISSNCSADRCTCKHDNKCAIFKRDCMHAFAACTNAHRKRDR